MPTPSRRLTRLSPHADSAGIVRPLANRVSRRSALQGAGAIGAAAAAHRLGLSASAQTPEAAGAVVGVGSPGQSSIEFLGRIDQDGGDFNLYGYLTHVASINDATIFTNDDPANRTEADARLTFFGTARLIARSILENLFAVTANGEIRVYANEKGGGRFDRPESFFSGTQIAAVAVRIRSIINVQAPQAGIAGGTGTFTVIDAQPFSLGGDPLILGGLGAGQALTYTGQGTLLDPAVPKSFILAAGAILPAVP